MSRRTGIGWVERLVFLGFLLAVMAVNLFPFLWMVSCSFKGQADVFASQPPLLPTTWTWENYAKLLEVFDLGRYFANSLMAAGGVTLLSLAINGLAAFAFAWLQFPGRERIFALLMLSMLVPLQVTLLPLFLVLKILGLLNTMAGLILPGSASVLGIFLLRQFMKELPGEIIEQARIDGCSDLQLFWRIILPLCRPVFASLAVFTFVGAWNEFLGPLVIMLRDGGYTLPVALATLRGEHSGEWAMMMSGAVLSVIPSLLVFIVAQRYYLRNITAGAIR